MASVRQEVAELGQQILRLLENVGFEILLQYSHLSFGELFHSVVHSLVFVCFAHFTQRLG